VVFFVQLITPRKDNRFCSFVILFCIFIVFISYSLNSRICCSAHSDNCDGWCSLTAGDKMGNCFKASSHDDISLLQDSDVPDNNGESHAPVVPPPPPYQVITVNCVAFNSNMNGFRSIYLFFVLSNSVFFFSGVPLMYCCCVDVAASQLVT